MMEIRLFLVKANLIVAFHALFFLNGAKIFHLEAWYHLLPHHGSGWKQAFTCMFFH